MPEVGEDRESRAAAVRKSVHAYFMWHTGQLPGITREWIDNRARNISNEFVSSELIIWVKFSLKNDNHHVNIYFFNTWLMMAVFSFKTFEFTEEYPITNPFFLFFVI